MMMTTADHVKMESPFYHEETLSLQDFSHFSAAYSGHLGSGPGAPRAGRYPEHKLMVGHPHGHLKKKSGAPLPPPSPGHFPEVITRSAGTLKLLPTASGGGLGGSPPGGGRGGVASPVITVAGISVGPAAGGPSSPSDAALLAAGPQPSLNLLKLSSPELEHLIIQANPDLAPTAGSPPHALPAQPFLYRSQGITQEQEGFADGFVKALADLHKQNQLLGAPPLSPSAAASLQGAPYPRSLHPAGEAPVYTNLSSFSPTAQLSPPPGPFPVFPTLQGLPVRHHTRLEEPQTVPEGGTPPGPPLSVGVDPCAGVSPPSLSPMDPETQERIKAERKRLRNRIAASKCRKRKLERIARLEEKVKVLKSQNSDLASTASLLREQVSQLKQKVHSHVSSGCQIPAKASPPLGKAEATGR